MTVVCDLCDEHLTRYDDVRERLTVDYVDNDAEYRLDFCEECAYTEIHELHPQQLRRLVDA